MTAVQAASVYADDPRVTWLDDDTVEVPGSTIHRRNGRWHVPARTGDWAAGCPFVDAMLAFLLGEEATR